MRNIWKVPGIILAFVAITVFAGLIVAQDMSNKPGMTHENKATANTASKNCNYNR